MNSFSRPTLFLLLALVIAPPTATIAEEKKKDAKKPAPAAQKPAKVVEPKKTGIAGLGDLPIPKGSPQKEIRFPVYTPDGKKTTYYRIGVATWRDDNENIDLKEMELQTYDAQGKEEYVVKLPDAVLNVPTNVITANAKILIRDERFEITANSLRYDMNAKTETGAKESVATLGGGVTMTIFDADAVLGSGKKKDSPEFKIEPLTEEPTKK